MAGLCGLIIYLVSVVVGEFFPCLDILDCHKPDDTPELFRVAVGLTRMIDKACGVFRRIAINGIALVSSKDIDVACG